MCASVEAESASMINILASFFIFKIDLSISVAIVDFPTPPFPDIDITLQSLRMPDPMEVIDELMKGSQISSIKSHINNYGLFSAYQYYSSSN